MRFRWLGNPNFVSNVTATCEVRSKDRYSWIVIWDLSKENGGLAFDYPERTISLRSWLGDSVEVAFHAVGTNGADFGVDEIETGSFPVTRRPPNDGCEAATRPTIAIPRRHRRRASRKRGAAPMSFTRWRRTLGTRSGSACRWRPGAFMPSMCCPLATSPHLASQAKTLTAETRTKTPSLSTFSRPRVDTSSSWTGWPAIVATLHSTGR